jgi:hypothetical protein
MYISILFQIVVILRHEDAGDQDSRVVITVPEYLRFRHCTGKNVSDRVADVGSYLIKLLDPNSEYGSGSGCCEGYSKFEKNNFFLIVCFQLNFLKLFKNLFGNAGD